MTYLSVRAPNGLPVGGVVIVVVWLGGGFYFHPNLGKSSNLTVAYFSDELTPPTSWVVWSFGCLFCLFFLFLGWLFGGLEKVGITLKINPNK